MKIEYFIFLVLLFNCEIGPSKSHPADGLTLQESDSYLGEDRLIKPRVGAGPKIYIPDLPLQIIDMFRDTVGAAYEKYRESKGNPQFPRDISINPLARLKKNK